MNCEKYLNLIEDLVEGELDYQMSEQVNLHIFACPECDLHYKTLKNEKQIYNHYLFNVEPSNDLWKDLQQKINSESVENAIIQKPLSSIFVWPESILGFFRLNTAFIAVALLILFAIGFGVLKFAQTSRDLKAVNDEIINSEEVRPESSSRQTPNDKELASLPNKDLPNKRSITEVFVKETRDKISPEKRINTISLKAKDMARQIVPKRENKNSPSDLQSNPEQKLRELEAKNLEKDATRQVEKIELLLRSFRNARVVEGSDVFDVSYEKQQARKLLEKNVELRQIAQHSGNLYTEEILDKAESFLLDIANLESNPSPEKIINIKERVKNQNIIASLQVY